MRIPPMLTVLLAAALGLRPTAAPACGGFFCTAAPTDQVSENILFAVDGDSVTTYVQIRYDGGAEDFAWILPLPSAPELEVSHNEVFARLDFFTRPDFRLDYNSGGAACGESLLTVSLSYPTVEGIGDGRAATNEGVPWPAGCTCTACRPASRCRRAGWCWSSKEGGKSEQRQEGRGGPTPNPKSPPAPG